MVNHVRWYFNTTKWKPTKEEWLKLTSSIAFEELERTNKFVFQDDSKTSLIGRALIRKFLSETTSTPSNELLLRRTERGRPMVAENYIASKGESWPSMMDFNVSHSGDYCVLAGVYSRLEAPSIRVGVDVTKVVSKKSKQELDRFLELMSRKEFTKAEWESVRMARSDRQKCINFTRLWCLKESFIKAIGLGLAFDLNRIDFRFSSKHNWDISMDIMKKTMLNDTTVMLDQQPAPDWRFHETALDDEHMVALAYNLTGAYNPLEIPEHSFEELSIKSIVSQLTPIRTANERDWAHFSSREVKPVR